MRSDGLSTYRSVLAALADVPRSVQEIARELRVSETTVKRHLYRARDEGRAFSQDGCRSVNLWRRDGTVRRKVLRLTGEFLIAVFSPGDHTAYTIISDHVPRDARVVDVKHDGANDLLAFVLESAEFPEVVEGGDLPDLVPVAWRGASSS